MPKKKKTEETSRLLCEQSRKNMAHEAPMLPWDEAPNLLQLQSLGVDIDLLIKGKTQLWKGMFMTSIDLAIVPEDENTEIAQQLLAQLEGVEVKVKICPPGVRERIPVPFVRDETGYKHFGVDEIEAFVNRRLNLTQKRPLTPEDFDPAVANFDSPQDAVDAYLRLAQPDETDDTKHRIIG